MHIRVQERAAAAEAAAAALRVEAERLSGVLAATAPGARDDVRGVFVCVCVCMCPRW